MPEIDDGKIASSFKVEVTFSGCWTAPMTKESNILGRDGGQRRILRVR